jgi:hypothetical protein
VVFVLECSRLFFMQRGILEMTLFFKLVHLCMHVHMFCFIMAARYFVIGTMSCCQKRMVELCVGS